MVAEAKYIIFDTDMGADDAWVCILPTNDM